MRREGNRGWGRWLALTVPIAALATLSACGGSDAETESASSPDEGQQGSGPVELTFQSWVPNIDQAVDAFNSSQDEIEVTLETITAGPDGGYATMQSAVEAGNAADVAQVGYSSIPDFVVNNLAEDITEYVGEDADTFVDWQWQTGVLGENVYAVPQASGPLGMYYRQSAFEELGIDAPSTWEEFKAAAEEIRAADGDRYIAAFAFNQAPWMVGLAQQAGAQWFTAEEDAWRVDITGEPTMKMAEYWQELIDEDLVKIQADMSSEWNADIQDGDVLSWISGSWADAILRGTAPDTSGDWAVAPVPQWDSGEQVSATWDGGSASVVLRGTDHPEAAAEFALWLNSDPESVNILTNVGAGWPAIEDTGEIDTLQEAPEIFEFYGGQDIWDVFAESDANVDTDWQWPPMVSTLYTSLTDNVQAGLDADRPLTDAFEATQQDMIDAFDERGISSVQ